jgi:uncharacterized protein (DUF1499 family)
MPAPFINDISTDLENPPPLPKGPFPERFKAVVARAYPNLVPLRVERDADAVFDTALKLAAQWPRWSVSGDKGSRLITGVAISAWIRYRDDLVIRVQVEGSGARVDMRSASRLGRGDFGANAARIREFLEALRDAIGKQ